MTTISSKNILTSRNVADPDPDRKLSALLCRYPRWIHAEGRTHRLESIGEDLEIAFRTPSPMEEDRNLSKNASSSRAIPVKKLIEDIRSDPAVPLFWGKNVAGMQANEELGRVEKTKAYDVWMFAMESAIAAAEGMCLLGYDDEGKMIGAHKQIVNRLLEPFSHITVMFSGTEWSNFFALRIHDKAEPHIRMLAEKIKESIDNAPVELLNPGEWHLPWIREEDYADADSFARHCSDVYPNNSEPRSASQIASSNLKKLSTARCASTSYKTVEGFDMTLDKALLLHEKLAKDIPMHASPMEHVAQADHFGDEMTRRGTTTKTWLNDDEHRNFVGFRQYRAMLPGNTQ